ncbi:unnamed protein product [Adineta ricciae]|uniref:F-box domain-containing protein n=1 Tax=Adineta ricciae TaxID=249248 RepID=A0A815R110_ADIRI|nr:unnamed protein product [Adineta ricciae]CAF1618895.1 unnamed protein product [Adineta ricciae]
MPMISANSHSRPRCFEDLPDEILLSICRYLSPINILDSFLHLNHRLHRTIVSYREQIYLSHLSKKECFHLLNDHLPNLAPSVSYLYLDTRSMLNIGRNFENKFNRIDQQFPSLRQLIFRQIDIETLENLAWRFNTMNCLQELDIDIGEDRLASLPAQFNEYLCGKLFSVSNSFQKLRLHFNNYYFNLQSIRTKCENLRCLTISVKTFEDLLIIFDCFPNLEQLDVTFACDSACLEQNHHYSFGQLWWKVPYLNYLCLNLEQKELNSHDDVISNEILFKIIANIFSLTSVKFRLDLRFKSSLTLTTTREMYVNKYFPYVDGSLWQHALQRQDNHPIHFELHVELDGIGNHRYRNILERESCFTAQNNDIDFYSFLKPTFSNAYWLQKNLDIQCVTTSSKHVSIYTIPLVTSSLSTMVDTIDKVISVNSFPSKFHQTIQQLHIHSDFGISSPKLPIKNLFAKMPYLVHLHIDMEFVFPPTIVSCSNYLTSLSLQNYSLLSSFTLLSYLPNVKTLSLTNFYCSRSMLKSSLKTIPSVKRLKIVYNPTDVHNLTYITEYFPNIEEFSLVVSHSNNRLVLEYGQHEKYDLFLKDFQFLRFIELVVPAKADSFPFSRWRQILDSKQATYDEKSQNGLLVFKSWF